jgi:ABC-type transport system involved in multi-copper enzyme maturation permease subunit
MKETKISWTDGLYNIWVIAIKDIRDAIKSRLILSMIVMLGFLMATPRLLSLILVQPASPIAVYAAEDARLLEALQEDAGFTIQEVESQEQLLAVTGSSGIGPGIEGGLAIPAGFDAGLTAGNPPEVQLYVSWANRGELERLKETLSAQASELLGLEGNLAIETQLVYPSTDGFQMLGMLGMFSVSVIILMGLFLIPHLLIEEKRTKTLDALLVAPASIGQVVMGKTLAGMFYILVASAIVFLSSWAAIVHVEVAALFVVASGLVSTAIGLVIGVFFERDQDALGLVMVTVVLLQGAVLVDMLGVELPAFLMPLVPWIPSTGLTRMLWFSYVETVDWGLVGQYMGMIVRRLDR